VLCGFGPVSHIKEINNFIVNQQPEPSGGYSLKKLITSKLPTPQKHGYHISQGVIKFTASPK
jgi:hypothetical protein